MEIEKFKARFFKSKRKFINFIAVCSCKCAFTFSSREISVSVYSMDFKEKTEKIWFSKVIMEPMSIVSH